MSILNITVVKNKTSSKPGGQYRSEESVNGDRTDVPSADAMIPDIIMALHSSEDAVARSPDGTPCPYSAD
jgi:hypothetical protein